MNSKLTLSLDKEIIRSAKEYARQKDISLSNLVENYLLRIISEFDAPPVKKESVVDQLSGIVELPADLDYQSEHRDYLNEKYQ